MSSPLHIIAVGARTPVGLSAPESAASVRAGIRRLRGHPFMVDHCGEAVRSALDPLMDPKALGLRRLVTLGATALEEALRTIPTERRQPPRLNVLLALPETRPGISDSGAESVAREFAALPLFLKERLPPAEVVGRGHAGAIEALRVAVERVAAGRTELCAIVGVDSYFSPDTIGWLDRTRRLAADDVRDGFVPGEAAGCIVVGAHETAKRWRLPCLATVRRVRSSFEANVIDGPSDGLGWGLTTAIRDATADLCLPVEAIDDIYCDINGERYRTDEWTLTLLRVGATLRRTRYLSGAASWGDVGAASGVLSCVLAVRAWARGYATGARALVWGSSDGGLRSATILERVDAGGAYG